MYQNECDVNDLSGVSLRVSPKVSPDLSGVAPKLALT